MKVLNLRCGLFHGFEGWFASEDDCRTQLDNAQIECPVCGDKAIVRLPSAPHLGKGSRASRDVGPVEPPNIPAPAAAATLSLGAAEARWMQAVREVIARSEDVGERFADEARRIQLGDAEPRPIRGQASLDEAEALRDEGIEVLTLSMPAAAKEQMH